MNEASPQTESKIDAMDIATLSEVDLRRYRRFVCLDGGVVRLAVRPEFRGRRALLFDISAGGIGLVLEKPIEAGAVLLFELRRAAENESVNRVARVRHVRPHPMPEDAPWQPSPSSPL